MSLRVVVSKILLPPECEMYRMRKPAIGTQRADLRGFFAIDLASFALALALVRSSSDKKHVDRQSERATRGGRVM